MKDKILKKYRAPWLWSRPFLDDMKKDLEGRYVVQFSTLGTIVSNAITKVDGERNRYIVLGCEDTDMVWKVPEEYTLQFMEGKLIPNEDGWMMLIPDKDTTLQTVEKRIYDDIRRNLIGEEIEVATDYKGGQKTRLKIARTTFLGEYIVIHIDGKSDTLQLTLGDAFTLCRKGAAKGVKLIYKEFMNTDNKMKEEERNPLVDWLTLGDRKLWDDDYCSKQKKKEMKENKNYSCDAESIIENGVDDGLCDVGSYKEIPNEELPSIDSIVEALESKIRGRDVWLAKVYPQGLVTQMYYVEEISLTEIGIVINCDDYNIQLKGYEAMQLLRDGAYGLWTLIEHPRHLQEMDAREVDSPKGEASFTPTWVHKYVKIVFVEKVYLEGKRIKRDLHDLCPSIASVYGLVIRENSEAIAIAPMYSPSGVFTHETVEGVQIIPRGSIKFITEIKCECMPYDGGPEWG